jgi:L-serine/L-threonine ammonia-lyase
LIDEVCRTGLQPDAVVLSVGGGGLLSGIAQGLERNGWGHVPILAVETHGAASFHAALKGGRPVELERITSVATSLGAKRVCDAAVRWSQRRPIRSVVVSDRSALSACRRFLADHRILVEPACGASLALAYDVADELAPFGTVLFVVCGGATSTLAQIEQWWLQSAPTGAQPSP